MPSLRPSRFTQPLHRLFVPEMGFPAHFAPGFLRIEGRLRRIDEDDGESVSACEILIRQGAAPARVSCSLSPLTPAAFPATIGGGSASITRVNP